MSSSEVLMHQSIVAIKKQPFLRIDVENDEWETLAAKLGVKIPLESEIVVLAEHQLEYLNNPRDSEGNTLLMKFAERGKADVVGFLLRCDGLKVNAKNRLGETAADIAWSRKCYVCLLRLLQSDTLFPSDVDVDEVDEEVTGGKDLRDFIEQRCILNDHIFSGDLVRLKEATKCVRSSLYLSIDNVSALCYAARCEKLEAFAFLWCYGAKFKDEEESDECNFDISKEGQLDRYLGEYFTTHKNSHVFKLLSCTKVRGDFPDERIYTAKKLYEHLNAIRLVVPLMRTVEYEDLDIVFDFESEFVDRICYSARGEVYGLTVPMKRRIYIGAKGCDTENTTFAKVAGTLAHELCHMALSVLHGHNAKPYNDEDLEKKKQFDDITMEIKGRTEELDEIIRRVFVYSLERWHSEMIVRVPHVLAMLGERKGKQMLREQVPELLNFYEKNVFLACESYSKCAFFKKPLCLVQPLMKYLGCIKDADMIYPPLRKSYQSFATSLIPLENISLLVTTNTKLSCLHVYFELKELYGYHMGKRCLFFEMNCFEKNFDTILEAFTCTTCEYLVLVANDKSPNYISTYFRNIELGGKKCVILIARAEYLQEVSLDKCKGKVLDYQWKDFSDSYKEVLMRKTVRFKGRRGILKRLIDEAELSKLIQPKDLLRLTDGDDILFDNGENLLSEGYNTNYFFERSFVKTTVKTSLFDRTPDSCALFITGLDAVDAHAFGIKEAKTQWISGAYDQLFDGKRIFLLQNEKAASKIFEDFFNENKTFAEGHWLHFWRGEFFWKSSIGNELLLREYLKEDSLSEMLLMEISHRRKDRVVLISDDPGTGKTTVLSDLINKIKNKWPHCWIGRINLNEFADDDEGNPLGLANIKDDSGPGEVIDFFIRILGKETKLESELFKCFLKGHTEKKIFIDGFDEVSPLYKKNVLNLLRMLKKDTNMQLWICTRKHEENDLESEMDVFSYRMRPLTSEDQEKFLNRLWKEKLKPPDVEYSMEEGEKTIKKTRDKIKAILAEAEVDTAKRHDSQVIESLKILAKKNGESKASLKDELETFRSRIDKLNFTSYARVILDNARVSMKDYGNLFTGTPLHTFMLGELAFNENLKNDICSDIYNLYLNFVERKFRIYFREKCRFMQLTKAVKNHQDEKKKDILEFHEKLSQFALMPEKYQWDWTKNENIMNEVHDIGIVRKSKDCLRFIHRTFAEFFFSSWLLKQAEGDEMEDLLEKVLLDPKFHVVRRFIDGAFHNNASFNRNLIKELDVKLMFIRYVENTPKEDMESCKNIWKYIFRSFESVCYRELDNEFIQHLKRTLKYYDGEWIAKILRLLDFCLSDKLYFKVLESLSLDSLVPSISHVSLGYVSEFLRVITRVMYYNAYNEHSEQSSGAILCISREEVDRSFDMVSDPYIVEQTLQLLRKKDKDGMNIFHCASKNDESNVFCYVLGFAKGIVGNGAAKEYLKERTVTGETILHVAAENGARHTVTILNELMLILEGRSFIGLLKEADEKGKTFLHRAASIYTMDELKPVLDSLRDTIGSDSLVEILTHRTEENKTVLTTALYHAILKEDVSSITEILNMSNETWNIENFLGFVFIADNRGQNIYHLAVCTKNLQIIQIVQHYMKGFITKDRHVALICYKTNYNYNILHHAVETCNIDVINEVFGHATETLGRGKMVGLILQQVRTGYSVFHLPIVKSNLFILSYLWSTIKPMLNQHDKINLLMMEDEKSCTALHHAVLSDDASIVNESLLICKEALPEEKLTELILRGDYNRLNVYHLAVHRKNIKIIQIVQQHLKQFIATNRHKLLLCPVDENSGTILHHAVETRKIDVINVVFEHAKEIVEREKLVEMFLQQGKNGQSLFHKAILNKEFAILCHLWASFKPILNEDDRTKLLMMVDVKSRTALHHEVLSEDGSIVMEVLKICKEALPEEKFIELIFSSDSDGHTAYNLAVNMKDIEIVQIIQDYTKDFLTKEGHEALICSKTKYDYTILHHAVETCNLDVIEKVFDQAREYLEREKLMEIIMQKVRTGYSVFHLPIVKPNCVVLRHLWSLFKPILNQDEKIKLFMMADEDGRTALHHAVLSRDGSVLKEVLNICGEALRTMNLIELIFTSDVGGDTAYNSAVKMQDLEIIQIMQECLKDFLNKKKDKVLLSSLNKYNYNILHHAVETCNIDIIKKVFEHASEILPRENLAEMILQKVKQGHSVFHFPIVKPNLLVLSYLWSLFKPVLTQVDKINLLMMVDEDNRTALHYAVLSKDVSFVKEMLKIFSESLPEEKFVKLIFSSDADGDTAYNLAKRMEDCPMIDVMGAYHFLEDDGLEYFLW